MKWLYLIVTAMVWSASCYGEPTPVSKYIRISRQNSPQYPTVFVSAPSGADSAGWYINSSLHEQPCVSHHNAQNTSVPFFGLTAHQMRHLSKQEITNRLLHHVNVSPIDSYSPGLSLAQLSVQQQEELLKLHGYYCYENFLTCIKSLPEYSAYIQGLHDLYKQSNWIQKLYYCWTDKFPLNIHRLRIELEQEQQKKKRQATGAALRTLQENEEKLEALRSHAKNAFSSYLSKINQDKEEQEERYSYYRESDPVTAMRLEKRMAAISEINDGAVVFISKSYGLSRNAIDLIQENNLNAKLFTHCYGNQYQQLIHQESIAILECAAALPQHSIAYSSKDIIARFSDVACEYNQIGSAAAATAIVDFCWALLDCGKAALEGAAAGVIGSLRDFTAHPFQTAVCAVAAPYVLAYQLCKVACDVAEISLLSLTCPSKSSARWQEYIAPLNQLIEAITNKEIELRNAIRFTTQVAVQWKIQGKLLAGLGNLFHRIGTQALAFAQRCPTITPQQYMATPDGMLFSMWDELNKFGISHPPRFVKSLRRKLEKRQKDAKKLVINEVNKASLRALVKKYELPIKGKVRYLPPKRHNPKEDLPQIVMPDHRPGYIDRFGNIWIGGESRTKGQAFEWDVQLSERGKRMFGCMTRDSTHLNVSLDGRITHK